MVCAQNPSFPRLQCILFGPGNESTNDWTNVSWTERHQSVSPMFPMMVPSQMRNLTPWTTSDFDGLVSPFSMPFLRYCWFVLALCPAVEGLLLIYAWQRPSDWLAGILSSAYLLLVEAWLQLVFVSSSTLYPYISDFLGCPHCW